MVHFGNHLRLGITCGPFWGSFAALYSSPVGSDPFVGLGLSAVLLTYRHMKEEL